MTTSTRWRMGAVFAAAATVLGGVSAASANSESRIMACGDRTFNAEAVLSGSTWRRRPGRGEQPRRGTHAEAVGAGVRQRFDECGSRITLPSYTGIDVCGTINVNGTGSGDQNPIYCWGTRDVEVRLSSSTVDLAETFSAAP